MDMLIIEDEVGYVDTLKGIFPNESIDTANRVLDAFRLVMDKKYNTILLDLKLPDGCGIKLAPRLKEYNPNAKIIAVTGFWGELKKECEKLIKNKVIVGIYNKVESTTKLKGLVDGKQLDSGL